MDTSDFRHSSLTRDQVLVAYAAEMIARTSFSQDDFAHELSLCLHKIAPEKAVEKGVPNFDPAVCNLESTALMRAIASWSRRVIRWLCSEVELPVWVEEAWVQALPAEYRERCLNELAGRYGLTGARALSMDACPVGAFGQLVAQLGHAVELGSAILADGKIGAEDLPLLPAFVERLRATEARCGELRVKAEGELAKHAAPVRAVAAGARRA